MKKWIIKVLLNSVLVPVVEEVLERVVYPKLEEWSKKTDNKYDDAAVQHVREFLDFVTVEIAADK